MGWNDQRKNSSTVGTSQYWQEELGIESGDVLEKRLRGQMDAPNTVVTEDIETANFDTIQVMELCKLDLDFLAAMAMPDLFKYKFPASHKTAWMLLTQAVINDPNSLDDIFPQIALGIPRGHAKTTLIKLFILWCVLFTNRKFILVSAAIEQRAVDTISDIFIMLDEPNIKGTFGWWKVGAEKDTISLKIFGYRGRRIAIAAVGAEGSVRGMNINNQRPDVMVFDDIQSKECSDSKLQSDSLETWMIGTAMKAKSPSGCVFIFAGNMFPSPYSILKKLKTNGRWIKFISGAILADGSALWPELRSIKSLMEELDNDISMGRPELFFSEVMNDTDSGMNSSVDFSKFAKWEWTSEDVPQGKFIIIDPSQGKNLDFDAIGRFEIYDEQLAVREIHEEKLSPGNLIRTALIMAIKHGINLIAIEAMAYQFTLLYWFEEVCKSAGITGIQCVPLYATTTSKNSRITSCMKALMAKEITLHPSILPKVQKQIVDWNPMKKNNIDDMLDVIAHGPKIFADYTYEIASRENILMIETTGAKVEEDNFLF